MYTIKLNKKKKRKLTSIAECADLVLLAFVDAFVDIEVLLPLEPLPALWTLVRPHLLVL